MLKSERQEHILREVNIHNKVLCSDLSIKLRVSEDTIRRDLNELAEQDKVIKVHGGALSKSYHTSTYRQAEVYSLQEKTIIAGKAVTLLKEGMLVFVSGGTTNRELARILPPHLSATFFTPSLSTAIQLMEHPSSEVILLGGKVSRNAGISVGGEVIRRLTELRADLCILGTNSIDPEEGITDSDWEVVQVKKAMIKRADKVAALALSEKLNSTQRMKVCDINQIDYLITELPARDNKLLAYRKSGLEVL